MSGEWYYNAPLEYTMSVAALIVTESHPYLISRYGREAIVDTLAYARQCNGVAVLIRPSSDLVYETSTEQERKYGRPERLTVVVRESLTREKVVFSEIRRRKSSRKTKPAPTAGA